MEWGVKLKFSKCDFLASRFLYLGLYIDKDGWHPDPTKVRPLLALLAPRNVKESRSFYGLASYFRRILPNFADITLPLSQLLKSSERVFRWDAEQQLSFDKVKDILSSAPLLKLPTAEGTFVFSTDASSFAMGACLEQFQNDLLVPICYFSRVFNRQKKTTQHARKRF
jgi:hypothetical protein